MELDRLTSTSSSSSSSPVHIIILIIPIINGHLPMSLSSNGSLTTHFQMNEGRGRSKVILDRIAMPTV